MPFASKAQMRKFTILVKQGKMTPEKFKEFKTRTENLKKLPEKVRRKVRKI